MLNRLSQLDPATLHQNAELFGLSERSALTLDALFLRTYRLFQQAYRVGGGAGIAPSSGDILADLVRAAPDLAAPNAPVAQSAAPKPRAAAGQRLPVELSDDA